MTFATIGLLGALAVVVSLVAAAVLLQLRERGREADFDAEAADLREEMLRLEARELGDPVGDEGDAFELPKAELGDSRPAPASWSDSPADAAADRSQVLLGGARRHRAAGSDDQPDAGGALDRGPPLLQHLVRRPARERGEVDAAHRRPAR